NGAAARPDPARQRVFTFVLICVRPRAHPPAKVIPMTARPTTTSSPEVDAPSLSLSADELDALDRFAPDASVSYARSARRDAAPPPATHRGLARIADSESDRAGSLLARRM